MIRYQPELAANPSTKELPTYLQPKKLSDRGRDRVSDLSLGGPVRAANLVPFRECLEEAHLLHGQPAVLPMERASSGPRLRLDSPRWAVLCELQQERPIPRSPSKEWSSAATPRVPLVVLPFGNTPKEITPLPTGDQTRIGSVAIQMANRVPSSGPRLPRT